MKKPNPIEQIFETLIWKSRLIILLAVIFSIIGSMALFIAGSIEIFETAKHLIPDASQKHDFSTLLIGIIGAIDLYLIGIVLLIFAFGIYELFISEIDIARQDKTVHILEVHSLDELKNKLLKVVVMVLIVSFFKSILSTTFSTALEMLYLGLSILAIAGCVFFIRNVDNEK